jgi:serine/threonine protein kinase
MLLAPGTRLGPYEIVALIGSGGMGEVYKAKDTRLERVVALKISKMEFSERFEREARAVAALNHSNICTLYDVGPNYLVMEYIEGKPLKGPMPVDQALKYATQICDALDAAHKKAITHRDLKPDNILLTKTGIKLLDFGLAKTARATASPVDATFNMTLTGNNEIVGTLYYMSPEQLQGSTREIDARSDIFSFGLVFYEMLTGKRAFDGSSPASVIAAIMERPAPSITDIAPRALDRALQRCLAKDAGDRWQSARDLKAELEWIGEADSGSGVPAQVVRKDDFRKHLGWVVASVFSWHALP